jgi:hypothetical protein
MQYRLIILAMGKGQRETNKYWQESYYRHEEKKEIKTLRRLVMLGFGSDGYSGIIAFWW